MRVLILSHRVPYPNTDGGAIVANAFIDALLAQHVQVDMLSFNTTKHFVSEDDIAKNINIKFMCYTIPLDNKVSALPASQNLLFAKQSYNYSRFNSRAYSNKLVELLAQNAYDIVHLENMYLGHYIDAIRQNTKAKITCRIHNIEYKIWQKVAQQSSSIKAWYLDKMSQRLKQDEIDVLNKVDFLFGLQTGELKQLQELGVNTRSALIPFGVKIPKIAKGIIPIPLSFCHIGSMDWLPNQEAVHWFLENVWPLILQTQPNATLHLAGKNMSKEFKNLVATNVTVHGNVDNQYHFMRSYDTVIVPLLSGAGIRVKVIEALALGKKVVSTSLGVDGISVDHIANVRIADSAQKFAEQCLISINIESSVNNENARDFIIEHYNDKTAANDLYKYLSLLMHGQA
jgi:polysaccharide biosynthesis protein PslH